MPRVHLECTSGRHVPQQECSALVHVALPCMFGVLTRVPVLFCPTISKSEIRYEGVLFNINTAEASIELSNVRSFGTEGRKKDGPQIPPSGKVYGYVLFRGSDIKDLQVKASSTIQTTTPICNNPTITQSHCSQAALAFATASLSASGSFQHRSSHASQMGLPESTFQGSLPSYQPNVSSGSWGSLLPPPPTNGSGLTTPMYSPGFYGVSDGLQAQKQSLLSPFGTDNMNFHSSSLPGQPSSVASGSPQTLMSNKLPTQALSPAASSSSLPLVSQLTTVLESNTLALAVPGKSIPGSVTQYNGASEPEPSVSGTSSSFLNAGSTPFLVTPAQFLFPAKKGVDPAFRKELDVPETEGSGSEAPLYCVTKSSSSDSSQRAQRDVDVTQASSSELPIPTLIKAQAPILPWPSPPVHKTSHPAIKFTEDFDFTAMNEKFNKDGVWGDIGKSNKTYEDGNDLRDENGAGASKFEGKPAYVKDDFFDSLSCNALDRGSRNGRVKFSEQRKIDAETFGDFARRQGGGRSHGGRGLGHGGYWRGAYYPRSCGYIGRGRGHWT